MVDNQLESVIEQRHLPPPVPKNKRKFLRSHLSARIMIIHTDDPTDKSCSLSAKRAY